MALMNSRRQLCTHGGNNPIRGNDRGTRVFGTEVETLGITWLDGVVSQQLAIGVETTQRTTHGACRRKEPPEVVRPRWTASTRHEKRLQILLAHLVRQPADFRREVFVGTPQVLPVAAVPLGPLEPFVS